MDYSVTVEGKKKKKNEEALLVLICYTLLHIFREKHTLHRRTVYYLLPYEKSKCEYQLCTEKLWKDASDTITEAGGRIWALSVKLKKHMKKTYLTSAVSLFLSPGYINLAPFWQVWISLPGVCSS